jgi:uncharacterized protein (TIGR03435 family)
MGPRYTKSALDALRYARDEARYAGATAIGTEHVLLGLLVHGKGLSANLLRRDGATADTIRASLRAGRRADGVAHALDNQWRFTPRAARAMTVAGMEATELSRPDISTDCVFLGIVRDDSTAATQLLGGLGINTGRLLEEIRGILRYPYTDSRPHLSRSAPVRIRPTTLPLKAGRQSSGGPDFLSVHNIDLKELIAEMAEVDESLIEWPEGFDDEAPYDVDAQLEEYDGQEALHRLVLDAIRDQFQLRIERQSRPRAVYVLTATAGPPRSLQFVGNSGGGAYAMSIEQTSDSSEIESDDLPETIMGRRAYHRRFAIGAPNSISGQLDMAALCRMLAGQIGRPFIDETHLEGSYKIEVRHSGRTLDTFFAALRDQAGLVATAAERTVEMLVVARR